MKGLIHWLQLFTALASLIANVVRLANEIIRTGWV